MWVAGIPVLQQIDRQVPPPSGAARSRNLGRNARKKNCPEKGAQIKAGNRKADCTYSSFILFPGPLKFCLIPLCWL